MSSINASPSDRVLSAAQDLLDAGGGAALTMEKLAERCGLSRATLYRRFGSRAGVLQRLAAARGRAAAPPDAAEDFRGRILNATRELIGSTGSINFTIDQVAAAAGVGPATVYRHFGTREGLLEASAVQGHPRKAALALLENAGPDPAADLRRFAASVLAFLGDRGNFSRLALSGDPKVREFLSRTGDVQERTLHRLAAFFGGLIASGWLEPADPLDLATAFFGMIMGFAFVKPGYTGTVDDPGRVAALIVRIFLGGQKKA